MSAVLQNPSIAESHLLLPDPIPDPIPGVDPVPLAHERFMHRALALAAQGAGYTSPNPMVGAVVVREGVIVGEGYHRRAGGAHAEVEALTQAGEAARGATIYVTLEPCNHYGRTPPCTEAILQAGIAQVFYAVQDPNPQVSGRGHRRLQAAGVKVSQGPCTQEAHFLNRFFFHYITTGQPYVIAKFAASLDGKIATYTGESQWITGPAARQRGHSLRQACDAIAVGVNTVIADNPSLTTRIPEIDIPSHPRRFVLDSTGRAPLTARLFEADLPGQTTVATTSAMSPDRRRALTQQNVSILDLPSAGNSQANSSQVSLGALLDAMGQQQIMSVLVEGGGQLLGSFLGAGLIHEIWAFLAPIIIGGDDAPGPIGGQGIASLAATLRLADYRIEPLDGDLLIRGRIRNHPSGAPVPSTSPAHSSAASPIPESEHAQLEQGACTCLPAL